MVAFNTNLTTIFAILQCYIVITQSSFINELSSDNATTPPPEACKDPNDFPLFSYDTCISREFYTAIFLISIILAGISFLSLAVLLFCLCRRYRKVIDSDDSIADESTTSNGRVENLRRLAAPTTISDNKPPALSTQTEIGTYQSMTHTYNSSPYAVDDPVRTDATKQKRSKNKPVSESIPLETRARAKPTSTKPKPAQPETTDLDDYHDQRDLNNDSTAF